MKVVKPRAGKFRSKFAFLLMIIFNLRLGLLNQQMAGLASSLAGKTGTFQVFILIFCVTLCCVYLL